MYRPPLPFPQRLKQAKIDEKFSRFVNLFKKLEINIHFAEALAQMPNYAKFMKDIIRKKRKLDDGGTMNLSANCNDVIQRTMPQKMQDLGSFTIPYAIGNHEFGRALCDSRESINLIPSLMTRRLSLGELTLTNLTLQMENIYVVKPEGIIEDVLVNVGKFIFPVDFVVINMEVDKHVPLLLGRPFLAIGVALIGVKKGELTLRVGEEEVKFNLNQSLKQHDNEEVHYMRIEEVFAEKNEESEAEVMIENEKENEQQGTEEELLKFMLEVAEDKETQNKKKLEENVEKKSLDGIVLKELPKHLKYVFLGKERSQPMIIVSDLTLEEEKEVMETLK